MRLQTRLIAVRKINSSHTRSSLSEERIEKLAKLIIDSEGIISPIIVKRTSLESYEVVDRHFEYYAAVRARELSPLKGEMIQAIILEPENEENLLEQISLLREAGDLQPVIDVDLHKPVPVKPISFEHVFQAQFDDHRMCIENVIKAVDKLNNKLDGLSDKLVDGLSKELKAVVKESLDKAPKVRSKRMTYPSLKEIRALTCDQIRAFTPSQVGAFTHDQIKAFTPDQAKVFTSDQIRAFTDRNKIKCFNLDRLKEIAKAIAKDKGSPCPDLCKRRADWIEFISDNC